MQNAFQFVATTTTKHFNKGGQPASVDVNGNYPIQLTVIAGKCPARALVLNGTVAEASGIEAGNTYVFQANLRNVDSYGDNWNHTVLSRLSAIDLVQLPNFTKAFGAPTVVTIENEVKAEVEEPVIAGVEGDEDAL